MKTTLAIFLLLLAVACGVDSQNPDADNPLHYIHLRAKVPPTPKKSPINVDLPSKIPKKSSGTKTVDGCGVPAFVNNRVPEKNTKSCNDATEVIPHSYPWQAAVYLNYIWFCEGSLINEEYVLTPGHCCDGMSTATVILGSHDFNQIEATQQSFTTTELILHERYSPILIHNDICLLHLPRSVDYNDYIMPICLPAYSDPTLSVGTIVTVTGWGLIGEGTSTSALMAVDVSIYNHTLCNDYYSIVNDGIICSDSINGGSSGEPMNYVAANGNTVLHGIISFSSSAGCDSGDPNGFTKVEYYLDWISSNTGIIIDP